MFRAWQATPLHHTDDGRPCNATRGFATWLATLLHATRDAPLICCFDAHDGCSRRRELCPAYKADRPAVDPLLLAQIADCRALCKRIGLPVLTASDGLEADDLIAALAASGQAAELAVTVVSGDKDLAQLVAGPEDRWWDAGHREPMDARAVTKRFKVRPQQIPDWLALAGDAADNIAGVPGVGAATAARLLTKWGNLDTLFEHLPEVAGMRFRGAPRVAALLAEHEAQVRLARRLTAPLSVRSLPPLTELQRYQPPADISLLTELGISAPTAQALRQTRLRTP